MAARNVIARLIRNEGANSAGGGPARRRPQPSAAGHHAHRRAATAGAPTIGAASSRTTASNRHPCVGLHFSTAARPSVEDASQGREKRSPHSKLLRVCSDRNTNSHFAAIEADLLRLQWKESMDALVKDWMRHDNRLDDFVELERNVRAYVNKNLIDLKHGERRLVREWERWDEASKRSLSLSDHIRFCYFPYEDIITGIMHRSIAGEYTLSPYETKLIGGDESKNPTVEIHGRIALLSKAGKLLDAMTSFDVDQDDDDVTTEANGSDGGWTAHHTSCSNCHRSVVSGWFLLFRRLREATRNLLANADAADILEATTKLDAHPEQEALAWAGKWIDFCTANDRGGEREGTRNEEVGKASSSVGISRSDKPLLAGVVKILSMSENSKRRAQSVELEERLAGLFPEE